MSLSDFLYFIILPVMSVSVLLVFIHFLRSKTITDRVLSLDLLITIGIGFIGIVSMLTGQNTFLDIALIFGLIAFLGTIAFSYYLNKSDGKHE
jgi:multicomponent Na+:H+ antiporter subunit F